MPKARILIVEDEVVVARDLKKRLQASGYEVPELATSADDAMRKAAQTQPDLVLMDIVLKDGMDGIDVAELLRNRFGLPVIFITAYADEATLRRATITEPFGYLLKPFDISLVVITIEMALHKHKMEKEKEKLLADCRDALAQVKTLRGLLPICAWCKRIRDDRGYWQEVEMYIHEHSEADFTHGICPECTRKGGFSPNK